MIFEDVQEKTDTINVKYTKLDSIVKYIKGIASYKIIAYICILVLTSGMEIFGIYPVSITMLGVATLFNIPLLVPVIISIISMLILKMPQEVVTFYIFTFIAYIITTIAINIDGITKKNIIAIKLFASTIVVAIIYSIINSFELDYILSKGSLIFLVLTVYYIFIYGFYVIINVNKGMIYATEEIIAMVVMMVLTLSTFRHIPYVGNYAWTVISIALVVSLSYYRGALSGLTMGMTVGIIVSIITGNVIISLGITVAAIVASLLNRLNRILVYVAISLSAFMMQYLYVKELQISPEIIAILIGSTILIMIPRKIDIKIKDIYNKNSTLKKAYEKELDVGSDVKNRLGAISEVFDNLSSITLQSTEEDCLETQKVIEKYLLDYKESNCLNCSNRYYCMKENMDIITKYISKKLENNEEITRTMLPCDLDEADKMIKEIKDIYNNIKLMRIIKAKEKESSLKLANEYKEVASVIKSMAKEEKSLSINISSKQKTIREELKFIGYTVYEDKFTETDSNRIYEFITDLLGDVDLAKKEISAAIGSVLGEKMNIKLILNSSKNEKSRIKLISDGKFMITTEALQRPKIASEKCGDTYYITETKNGNKFIALSDGMGAGDKAEEVSKNVIDLFEKLLKSGIETKGAASLINSIIKIKEKSNVSATIDITILDVEKEIASITKMGAAPTYVICDGNVKTINKFNMPAGINSEADIEKVDIPIKKGMFIVNITDGLDNEYTRKYIELMSKKNLDLIDQKEIAKNILDKTKEGDDDCTVIITRIE